MLNKFKNSLFHIQIHQIYIITHMKTKNKTAIVVGSGFAGLSAACFLAKSGYKVTLLEKNATLGGRARMFEIDGFRFDMGPSWYWMPDVFDTFFAKFDKKVSDYYHLSRLDPGYRVFFGKDDCIDIPADQQALHDVFEQYEKGAGARLAAFLKDAAYKYEVGMHDFVYRPSMSLLEFTDSRFFKGLIQLDLLSSFAKLARKYFSHPKLLQIIEFPVLFLGATPQNTPAMYSLMNYADLTLGTWYPQGGMHEIIKGIVSLANELGVEMLTSAEVTEFEIQDKQFTAAKTSDGRRFEADVVIAAGDYHHIEQQVLAQEYRQYNEKYWQKRVMAPSSLLYYLGVDIKIPNLQHHNLFFDEDFNQHAVEIYDKPQLPSKPLFYASCPSKTDNTVAPEGSENLFLLVPTPPDLPINETDREYYFNVMMDRLEAYTGCAIRNHIVYKRSFAHQEFVSEYHSFKGNAYGLANTLLQTAILKPSLKSKKVHNLYYTGQLTVPGPGVPPSLISGEVAAIEIIKKFP